MTTAQLDVTETTSSSSEPDTTTRLTWGEMGGLAVVTAIACVGLVSLLTAQWGWHNGYLAVGGGVALAVGLGIGALAFDGRIRLQLDWAEVALLGATLLTALFFFLPGWRYAAADKDPGIYVAHAFMVSREGNVDVADPVEQHQLEVAEHFGRRLPGVWPGRADNTSTAQFYHYYPTLLATANDVAGTAGIFNATPLMAVVAVGLVVLAARRAAGTTTAALTAALLVTSMMQIWQARYPSTEVVAQMLLAGALLAAVLAIEQRWATGAFLTGLLTSLAFLARPDGFLYVLMLVGVLALTVGLGPLTALTRTKLTGRNLAGYGAPLATGAILLAVSTLLIRPGVPSFGAMAVVFLGGSVLLSGSDRRVLALAGGMILPLPYVLWNAFEARVDYTGSVETPALGQLMAISAVLLALGGSIRWLTESVASGQSQWLQGADRGRLGPRSSPQGLSRVTSYTRATDTGYAIDWGRLWTRVQQPVAIMGTVVAGITFLVLWLRPTLFGFGDRHSHFRNETITNLNADNLRTLALFVTEPGLLLVLGGVAVLLFGRSRLSLYVLLIPGLALLPVYLWDARISMRLMWWVRRFIPGILPVLMLLIALALAWALHHRFRSRKRPTQANAATWMLRTGAALTAALLVGTYASQSWALRSHQEMGGTWEVSQEIAAVSGDEQGVYLFAPYPDGDILHPLRNSPAPLWWIFDQVTARIPQGYNLNTIETYATAFPDQPVYLVTDQEALPNHLPADQFDRAHELVTNIVFWDESPAGGPGTYRPDHPLSLHRGLTIWHYTGV